MVRELLRLNQDPASVITLEDPIGAELRSVPQMRVGQLSDGDDCGYAAALRLALRQNAKALLVG